MQIANELLAKYPGDQVISALLALDSYLIFPFFNLFPEYRKLCTNNKISDIGDLRKVELIL